MKELSIRAHKIRKWMDKKFNDYRLQPDGYPMEPWSYYIAREIDNEFPVSNSFIDSEANKQSNNKQEKT